MIVEVFSRGLPVDVLADRVITAKAGLWERVLGKVISASPTIIVMREGDAPLLAAGLLNLGGISRTQELWLIPTFRLRAGHLRGLHQTFHETFPVVRGPGPVQAHAANGRDGRLIEFFGGRYQ